MNWIHKELISILESIHDALLRMNRSIQAVKAVILVFTIISCVLPFNCIITNETKYNFSHKMMSKYKVSDPVR